MINKNSNFVSYSIRGRSIRINVDLESKLGIYGDSFWSKIQTGAYEATTFEFIENLFESDYKNFIDIGAATGCMSLFAAEIGLNVIAVEPQELVFEALKKNIELNPQASQRISLEYALVSGSNDEFKLAHSFTPGAAGPITSGALSDKFVTMNDLLQKFRNSEKLGIKIDIEGAEFPLLCEPSTLACLVSKKPIIFLALHPGFKKPLGLHPSRLTHALWRLQALEDVVKLYVAIHRLTEIRHALTRKKIGLLGLLIALYRNEKDFIIQFI